jgi:hypothetical protein
MSDKTIERVIDLILKRKVEILQANGILQKPESLEYAWINGIYDDLIKQIKSC